MKHRKRMSLGIALAFSLLLLTACGTTPVETTFSFYNGITWDTTLEQLRAAEEVNENLPVFKDTGEDLQRYALSKSTDSKNPVSREYYYYLGRPIVIATSYLEDDAGDFSARRNDLRKQYGRETETDGGNASALYNSVFADGITAEDITAAAGWTLGDGTRVYLLTVNDSVYMVYFNEPGIAAMQEDVAAKQAAATPSPAPTPSPTPTPTPVPTTPPFSFRGGITWDTTLEELEEAEVAALGESNVLVEQFDNDAMVMLADTMADGTKVYVTYIFSDDQLVSATSHYEHGDTDVFAQQRARLSAEYGEPAETDIKDATDYFSKRSASELEEGTFSAYAGWLLSDDSRIFLLDTEDYVSIFYINEPEMPDWDD